MELDEILLKRGFIFPSCEIYGGLSGFYDYGHLGTLIKRKFENLWRNYFLKSGDNFYEIETCNIMHEKVFVASGHLKNFVDPIVECKNCHKVFRADHLIEEKTKESAEHLNTEQLDKKIVELNIQCPKCKKSLDKVKNFNLMFPVIVGTKEQAYLRPETAQGCYTSFKRLFESTRRHLPLGLAIIGKAFRNEISPRQGIYRMREFTQAELQIFFNPSESYWKVEDYDLIVEDKEINSKELLKDYPEFYVYFLIKVQQFYLDVLKVDRKHFRFRVLREGEKAFYNKFHFDIELLSKKFKKFREVGGVHYRTNYDLSNHEKTSKENMHVEGRFIPHVLELSFGVDRNIQILLEQSYAKDKNRVYLSLNPSIAPISLCIFPIVNRDGLYEKSLEIYNNLKKDIDCFFDSSGSIGRRYARADETGIPYCITIDYDTLKDNTITIRDRDTTEQIRTEIDYKKIVELVKGMINFNETGYKVSTRKK
ncbi:MAG: glycine--tRNA ligase [Candidatus Aenigmarchaeota archaeon ex4484_56]|nr:MAG: glycine--tRNA ligase [Candidatus Aenigmarchaeota archaeon ex4484_56]